MPIYRLENVVQPYAWGSTTAISGLLGLPGPTEAPQAELWMGTHPKGPSTVVADEGRMPLHVLIERQPADILGPDVARRFGNALPCLFKVLAAARPLSIQAHPGKRQAEAGFARENREGKPLDAPDRNYRDDNHKPEIICALTPFWGLNGFRSAETAAELVAPVCPPALEDALRDLKRFQDGQGLKSFFVAMMTLSADQVKRAAREIVEKAEPLAEKSPVYRWMGDLARAYPTDMGILSPALLNLICLTPGEAMYLPAGQLHAYLDGVGIELMANSDNVLRGGLTPKHVDVAELLSVVRFAETAVEILKPEPVRPAESGYPSPAAEFVLSVVQCADDRPYRSASRRNVEILLCTRGAGRLQWGGGTEAMSVRQGDSFLVPASLDAYSVCGNTTLYKASVP
jgi:mannose-6-phosphate isomerase